MNPMAESFPDPLSIPSLGIPEIDRSLELLMGTCVPDEAKERFLLDLHARGETAAELAGFARVLLGKAVIPVLERRDPRPLLELCGTGGDRAGFLNISTAAMFVAAGAGARVVKHGNRAFTSKCGSADVLEALGVNVHLDPSRVGEVLEKAGCVFMLAANFHPAVAAVAPLRRRLGERRELTIFNLLGPLLNPASPDYQLTGIYRSEMLPLYAEALGLMGRKVAWAVHGEGVHPGEGVDELSITGPSRVVAVRGECPMESEEFTISPAGLGFPQVTDQEILLGGDAVENATRIRRILSGRESGAARDMIMLNAAAALHLAGIGVTLHDALHLASESIDAGKALRSLELLRSASVSSVSEHV